MTTITRRAFLAGSSVALAGSSATLHGRASENVGAAESRFYYDSRFPLAEHLARELAHCAEPTAVDGDITSIWDSGLRHVSLAQPLDLRGITTESFHFCMRTLLEERARLETRIERLDRNLHLWSMRTIGSR